MDGLAFGTGSAIAHRAVGAVFGGTVPPDAAVFARFCAQLRASRMLSFAGCGWLTSGALLHIIGVPLAIAPHTPLPPQQRQASDMNEAQRRLAADELAAAMSPLPAPLDVAA